ncbi:MAG TPA: hypothetical protein VGK84_12745 [Candidatus Tumulicola sp.]|jgi:hypothetical protein
MNLLHRIRHAIVAFAALGVLAGCAGGGGNPILSTQLPQPHNAQNMPAAETSSIITVTLKGKPVADAVIKLGWGDKCGLYGCNPYQKNGVTGPAGTKEYKGLPAGKVYFCLDARKGIYTSISCQGPVLIRPKISIDLDPH